MAEGFMDAGHVVWGCARDQAAVAELRRRWPAPHRFDAVDVSRDGDVARWAADAAQQGFVPELLINNAAWSTAMHGSGKCRPRSLTAC